MCEEGLITSDEAYEKTSNAQLNIERCLLIMGECDASCETLGEYDAYYKNKIFARVVEIFNSVSQVQSF